MTAARVATPLTASAESSVVRSDVLPAPYEAAQGARNRLNKRFLGEAEAEGFETLGRP